MDDAIPSRSLMSMLSPTLSLAVIKVRAQGPSRVGCDGTRLRGLPVEFSNFPEPCVDLRSHGTLKAVVDVPYLVSDEVSLSHLRTITSFRGFDEFHGSNSG